MRYRDVGHLIPFLVKIRMYVSPVASPVDLVPARWRSLNLLNPMAGVIEGFRSALLGTAGPDLRVLELSAAGVVAIPLSGIAYHKIFN